LKVAKQGIRGGEDSVRELAGKKFPQQGISVRSQRFHFSLLDCIRHEQITILRV